MPQIPLVTGPRVDLQTPNTRQFAAPDARAVNVNMPTPQYETPQLQLKDRQPILGNPGALSLAHNSLEPARELTQFGQDLTGAGDVMARVATDMQVKVNATVTDQALNDAREAAMRLTYGTPDGKGGMAGGYRNAKGYDALNRASGMGLPDEVAGDFDKQAAQISESRLTNDAQRRAFQAQVGSIRGQVYDGASTHVATEFDHYYESVYSGTIDNQRAAVTADYTNAPLLKQTLDQQDGAVAALVASKGLSAVELQAAQRVERSKTVSSVIDAAVADKKYSYAQAVLNTYKDQLDPTYLIKAKGLLDGEVQTLVGQQVGNSLFRTQAQPSFQPNDAARLANLVGVAESGNREIDPKTGKLIEGPQTKYGTAKGSMQVLDTTNLNPGYGVRPAADNSPAERARVGRDYLNAMVRHYGGDYEKALAAYNWGVGHMDGENGQPGVIQQANAQGKDWRTMVPPETQRYVAGIKAAYESGQGAPALPTKTDLYTQIDNDPRLQDPKARAAAYAEVDKHYSAAEADKKQTDEQVTSTAMQALDANGGDYDALPASLKAKIPTEKRDMVRTYGKGLIEGKDRPTNPAVYMSLTDDKHLLALNDNQFYATRSQLSDSQWNEFAKHRSQLRQGAAELNTSALNSTLETSLTQLGINPKPKATDTVNSQRVAAINQFVREATLVAQQQRGKKFSDDEQTAFVHQLFSRNQQFRTVLFGTDVTVGHGATNVMSARQADIPDADLKSIRTALQKQGNRNPTEADVLGTWWRHMYFKGGQ